ncbi:DUF1643 domain-containing protein [Desulfonatronum thioautotrophicum]|uniref:DUF1643 domain-containing protein n=1 Tax=Desulfonatronum thioautotrophicum TaxID=617001 RepID=UPI0005EAFE01|nr:DUF1643 domain-containing protein [Desulfonatronum thioautotrophicum]
MRFNHIPGVTVTADFAVENGQRYRYRLDVMLENPSTTNDTACVIMMNPSYACIEHADKSVQFMERVVFLKGLPEFADVGRLIVVNQFARIQTREFQGLPQDIGSGNNAAIQTAFAESDIIIVAWGCANPFRDRMRFVLDLLATMPGKRLYRTSKHPSRGKYAGFILPW